MTIIRSINKADYIRKNRIINDNDKYYIKQYYNKNDYDYNNGKINDSKYYY